MSLNTSCYIEKLLDDEAFPFGASLPIFTGAVAGSFRECFTLLAIEQRSSGTKNQQPQEGGPVPVVDELIRYNPYKWPKIHEEHCGYYKPTF